MDLKLYWAQVRAAELLIATRAVELAIAGESAVVVSLATPEGGVAGVRTEAPRGVAARLLADGRARLASLSESSEFHAAAAAARAAHESLEASRRIQVMVIPTPQTEEPEQQAAPVARSRRRKVPAVVT